MVAKSVGRHSTISALFDPLPPLPSPHTMLIYLEIWVQSLSTEVRLILLNVLSSKLNIVPGGVGCRFPLRSDLLIRPLKGRQSTFTMFLLKETYMYSNSTFLYLGCHCTYAVINSGLDSNTTFYSHFLRKSMFWTFHSNIQPWLSLYMHNYPSRILLQFPFVVIHCYLFVPTSVPNIGRSIVETL